MASSAEQIKARLEQLEAEKQEIMALRKIREEQVRLQKQLEGHLTGAPPQYQDRQQLRAASLAQQDFSDTIVVADRPVPRNATPSIKQEHLAGRNMPAPATPQSTSEPLSASALAPMLADGQAADISRLTNELRKAKKALKAAGIPKPKKHDLAQPTAEPAKRVRRAKRDGDESDREGTGRDEMPDVSKTFPSVVLVNDEYIELRCYFCGGNRTSKNAAYSIWKGVIGMNNHMMNCHYDQLAQNQYFDRKGVLAACFWKRLTLQEVEDMLSEAPGAYEIPDICPEGVKKTRPSRDVDPVRKTRSVHHHPFPFEGCAQSRHGQPLGELVKPSTEPSSSEMKPGIEVDSD